MKAAGNATAAAVTGANGFVGRTLCRLLRQQGWKLRPVVRPGRSGRVAETDAQAAELGDVASLARAFAGCDVVFHLAGLAHAGIRDRQLLRRVNVAGTAAVLEACERARVSRLVFFSSIMAETGRGPYADSKRAAEALLRERTAQEDPAQKHPGAGGALEVVILRPVNVYGPGMRGSLRTLIGAIARGWMPPLPALANRMALVSVEDLGRAALAVAATDGLDGRVYRVSDGQNYTPGRIEAAIYDALGRKKPRWRTPRVLFFAAAAVAETAARLGLYRGGLRLESYRSLCLDYPVDTHELQADTGFRPAQTFEAQLPEILRQLQLPAGGDCP